MNRFNKLFIAIQGAVWFSFGLFGKILPTEGRHEQIIETVFQLPDAHLVTLLIGFGEVALAFYIFSVQNKKRAAIIQIILIMAMNIIEVLFAPELLLFGTFNLLFAILFCLFICVITFYSKKINYATIH